MKYALKCNSKNFKITGELRILILENLAENNTRIYIKQNKYSNVKGMSNTIKIDTHTDTINSVPLL